MNYNQYFKQAKSYAQQKNFNKAIEYYQKTIQLNPNYEIAYNNLGNAYKSMKRYEEAVVVLKKAIKINPTYDKAYNNLGVAYQLQQKFPEALQAYRQAIKINPNYDKAYNNIGNVFIHEKKFNQAIQNYKKSLQINPQYDNAHYNLGVALQSLKRYQSAIVHFQQSLRINPQHNGVKDAIQYCKYYLHKNSKSNSNNAHTNTNNNNNTSKDIKKQANKSMDVNSKNNEMKCLFCKYKCELGVDYQLINRKYCCTKCYRLYRSQAQKLIMCCLSCGVIYKQISKLSASSKIQDGIILCIKCEKQQHYQPSFDADFKQNVQKVNPSINKKPQNQQSKIRSQEYKKKVDELQKQLNKKQQKLTCIICLDKQRSFVNIECGHCTVCQMCLPRDSLCPICRKEGKYVKIFMS